MVDSSSKKRKQKESSSKFSENESRATTTSERKASSNKKRALMHERQAQRPHYEEVRKAKEIWNVLREHNETSDDGCNKKADMVKEVMELFKGIFKEVVLKHDASRVVQTLIQYGTPKQHLIIIQELSESIPELSKSQYGHFVVLKLLKYVHKSGNGKENNTDARKKMDVEKNKKSLMKSFKGSIAKLCIHSVGARVMEFLFQTYDKKYTGMLKRELYGPNFSLFESMPGNDSTSKNDNSNNTLKDLLTEKNQSSTLSYVQKIIQKGMEKGLYSFAYFQDLLWNYLESCSSCDDDEQTSAAKEVIPQIVENQNALHLLSTRQGANVVSYCATFGTPKDRRKLMKSLKGYARSTLLHKDAFLSLLRLMDVTDDTVAIQKNILAELLVTPTPTGNDNDEDDANSSPLLEIALSDTGSKLFYLLLFSYENRTKYFDPSENAILSLEEEGISKKNPETRRRELLQYMKIAFLELAEKHTYELMVDRVGQKVLKSILLAFTSDDNNKDEESVKNIITNVVNSCKEQNNNQKMEVDGEDEEEKEEGVVNLFEHDIAHLFLKQILGTESRVTQSMLATELFNQYKGNLVGDIASSNRGAFILLSLLKASSTEEEKETEDKHEVRSELESNLKELKDILEKKKKSTTQQQQHYSVKGYEALISAIEEKMNNVATESEEVVPPKSTKKARSSSNKKTATAQMAKRRSSRRLNAKSS